MRKLHEESLEAGDAATVLDAIVERFEEAWQEGCATAIADFLAEADGLLRTLVLVELTHVDLEYRIKSGQYACADDYLRQFPTLVSLGVDRSLIEWEQELRQRPAPARVAAPRAGVMAPKIPGYEILGTLGRGGMGIVYKARQIRLNRLCALKMVLAGRLASPESILRFLAEAETIARLQHPNIVQIYNFGDHADGPFIELEYVGDRSLANRLGGTGWSPRKAAALVEQLARAIDEAHRQNVVHRDLKPSNVLLAVDGTPKIADFGLAKSLKLDDGLTDTHVVLGTPQYMAPEQAEGRDGGIGPAADIYSLGSILYEMLVGRPPFCGDTPLNVLQMVRFDDPVPPTRLRPQLPRDLETVCLKCLHKEPRNRYGTGADLAGDLRRFRVGESIRRGRCGSRARWFVGKPPSLVIYMKGAVGTAKLNPSST